MKLQKSTTTEEIGTSKNALRDSDSTTTTTLILTSSMFDAQNLTFAPKKNVLLDRTSGLIASVTTRSDAEDALPARALASQAGANTVIDLRDPTITVLPGLIDAHTHLFLHPYSEASNDHQRVNEGLLERTIRATVHARRTLEAGFTTVRDLGTESAGDADIALRNAIDAGIIPGPRILAASQAIVASGTYDPPNPNYKGGTRVPAAGDVADGVDGVRAAVRRRLGVGADVIKIYADYPRLRNARNPPSTLHPPTGSSTTSLPCFTPSELRTIVSEATVAKTPVAAHVKSAPQILACLHAGVHTIEHGHAATPSCFALMVRKNAVWVPTLAAVRTLYGPEDMRYRDLQERFVMGVRAGVRIAAGGDTGVFPHGDNAREMVAMVEAGLSVEGALGAGTRGGFEACGGVVDGEEGDGDVHGEHDKGDVNSEPHSPRKSTTEKQFGVLKEGWCADLMAVRGSMSREAFGKTIRDVLLVVKDGVVVVDKL